MSATALLSKEHRRIFDFAFEHFSEGRWQRATHRRAKEDGRPIIEATSSAGVIGDDVPCVDLGALTSLLQGSGFIVGSSTDLRTAVAELCVADRSAPDGDILLSYTQALRLATSLPSVVMEVQRKESRVDVGEAEAGSSPTPSQEALLKSQMQAIGLFVMFQRNGRLPMQSLRTVLATMGDEPLSDAELEYVFHPYIDAGQLGGLTLLQFLEMFKLL